MSYTDEHNTNVFMHLGNILSTIQFIYLVLPLLGELVVNVVDNQYEFNFLALDNLLTIFMHHYKLIPNCVTFIFQLLTSLASNQSKYCAAL